MSPTQPAAADDADDESTTAARLRALPSRLLAQTAMYADRLVSDGLGAAGTRKWSYAVLVTLREFGAASQSALSRRTGIYRSDMVAVINELVDQELVQRAPDPADQRRNVITLTTVGRRRLRQLDTLIDSLQAAALAPLTQPERDQFIGLLTRLVDHHGKGAPPPMHDKAGR